MTDSEEYSNKIVEPCSFCEDVRAKTKEEDRFCDSCVLRHGQSVADFGSMIYDPEIASNPFYSPYHLLKREHLLPQDACEKSGFVYVTAEDCLEELTSFGLKKLLIENGVVEVTIDTISSINMVMCSLFDSKKWVVLVTSVLSGDSCDSEEEESHLIQLWKKPVIYCSGCDTCLIKDDDSIFTTIKVRWFSGSEDKELSFCSKECYDDLIHGGDFPFFCCDLCKNVICSRNPNNGYETQKYDSPLKLDHDENDDESDDEFQKGFVCEACYEDFLLKHGHPEFHFKDSSGKILKKLHGMSFDHDDLEETGFRCLISYRKVGNADQVTTLLQEAYAFFGSHFLVFDVRPIGSFSFEAFVSLWGKERATQKPKEAEEPSPKKMKQKR